MTELKQFSDKFDVFLFKGKQSMDWGSTVPPTQWDISGGILGKREFSRIVEGPRHKWYDWLRGQEFL